LKVNFDNFLIAYIYNILYIIIYNCLEMLSYRKYEIKYHININNVNILIRNINILIRNSLKMITLVSSIILQDTNIYI